MQRIHPTIAFTFACGLVAATWLPVGSSPTALAEDAAHAILAPATPAIDAPPIEATATDESDATEPAATATATDEVQQGALEVQRALGGSVVNQFPTLQGGGSQTGAPPSPWWKQFAGSLEGGVLSAPLTGPQAGPSPPGHWPNWTSRPPLTTFIVPATAEFQTANPTPRPVAALRATAMELDASANRLEELDLYGQADAMRELAQQMRLDARRLATGAESSTQTPRPSDPAADGPPLFYGGQTMPSDPPRQWQRPNDPPRPARRPRNADGNERPGRADRAGRPDSDGGGAPTYPAPN